MANYQLYRAMTEITGQVRLDIGLRRSGTRLYVNNYNLAPICEKILFQNKIDNNDVLNNTHLENIKYLYNQIGAEFYAKRMNNRLLENKTPIILENIYKEDDWQLQTGIVPYDQTYEMGLSRVSYEKYNKQFAFFCPIWLDDFVKGEDDKYPLLKFKFKLKPFSDNEDVIEYVSELVIDINEIKNETYHDKFTKYIKDYIDTVTLNNRLLYIDTNKNKAYISGVLVDSGVFIDTLNVDYIIPNLTKHEHPFKEFNSLICNLFSQNKIIAKQAFNFNFIFDIDDLFHIFDIKNMMFDYFDFEVEVYVGDNKLEVKDYLYNYYNLSFNDLLGLHDTPESKESIFDYMKDNYNLDLEKLDIPVPDVPFFSCYDYNSIYNFYKGFNKINDNYRDNFLNYDMVDLYVEELDNNDWINFEELNQDGLLEKDTKNEYISIDINKNDYFKLGKVNFKRVVNNIIKNNEDNGISLIENEVEDDGIRKFIFCSMDINIGIQIRVPKNDNGTLKTDTFIVCVNENSVHKNFAKFLSYINDDDSLEFFDINGGTMELDENDEIYKKLKDNLKFFNNYVNYNVIVLDEIDVIDIEDSKKDSKIEETQLAFRDKNQSFVSLLRYEGNLLPYFCDKSLNPLKQVKVYKNMLDPDLIDWNNYYAIGLQPNYRSIGFYYLDFDSRINGYDLTKQIEYKNYEESNKYIIINNTYKSIYTTNSNNINETIVKEQFGKIVKEGKYINYLFDLFYYKYKCTNIELKNNGELEFTYEIIYKLK